MGNEQTKEGVSNMEFNRRDFLKGAAVSGAVAVTAGLMGCGPAEGNGGTSDAESAASDGFQYPGVTSVEDFENSAVEIEAITTFSDEKTYDIVVVGAGTSGIPAILTALEEGATVGCLQKESTPVSQGGSSSGFALDGSTDVGLLQFIAEYRADCDFRINRELLETYVQHSGETIMWMNKNATEAGFPPYTTVTETVDYEEGSYVTKLTNRFGPKPLNNGTMVEHMAELAVERGAEFFYETPAVQLVVDNGAVVGVIGKQKDGNYLKLNAAKAVILATGDYQNNDTMVEKYSPDLVNFERKQRGKTGDGHLLAMLVGAQMCPVNHSRQMHDADSGPMGNEPFLAVDLSGNRFMNEEVTSNYWNCILRAHEYPAGQFCHIFDSAFGEKVSAWGGRPVSEEMLKVYVPGSGVTPEEGGVSTGIVEGLIDTHYADTLEELAEALEIPADALKKSVDRYNELCEKGADDDFGKQSTYLLPIDTPPYWGIHRNIRITAICGGIAVDPNYQVLDGSGSPIPGLYSAGFNAGDICGAIDWSAIVIGMSNGSCMTSGRMAACHAINGTLELSNPVTWDEMKESYGNLGSGGGLAEKVH